jgi:hypothetical protein
VPSACGVGSNSSFGTPEKWRRRGFQRKLLHGAREQAHSGDDGGSLRIGQARQGGANPGRIEQGALLPQPSPRVGQAELDAAGVALVTRARDEAQPGESGELERDSARRNPHPCGELTNREGLDGIQLLQHAGEVGAEPSPARERVTVTAPAGRVNRGIGGQDSVNGILEHAGKWKN